MGLSRHEKENLGFLIGGGIALAVLSVVFRFLVERRTFGLPGSVFNFQYVIAAIILGLLMVLLWQANSQTANYAYAVMAFAFGLGMLFPPAPMDLREALMTTVLLPLVVGGGVYHYRFNSASNTLFVAFFAVLIHEFYLFGVAYAVLAFLDFEQPLILVGVLILSVMLYGIRRILADELDKTKDRTRLAVALDVFLSPRRRLGI
jgi:hypothetical protein